ncbi:MAG: HAMP domain-containing protein [Bacteroidaceae bacterium]|nr:HAMP domain-containing protein [Bacteroidaceae bacterium]
MFRLFKSTHKTLSTRLSLLVVLAMAVLLMCSLVMMLHYSRKTVKEEALEKASHTLDATVQRIDNILLSVEQVAGNMYFGLLPHIAQQDMMYIYSRKVVESNPYVVGCAIAFQPGFYRDNELFMAYFHQASNNDGIHDNDSLIVQSDTFGNCPYTEQIWFAKPIATGKPEWLNPYQGMEAHQPPILTFSLPIMGKAGMPVGVIAIDVSLNQLSHIILSAKPSANSYSVLLASDGSYIVHPDSDKLFHETVFSQLLNEDNDSSVRTAAREMVQGKTGYSAFHKSGVNYYIFYKPFSRVLVPGRSNEELGWSAGIVYPEDDIFGEYNDLIYYVFAIAAIGLFLLFMLCRIILHHQLKPLLMLTEQAQRIALGKYDEPVPDSSQEDEIGRLQDNFQQMQQSLASHITELEQLTTALEKDGESLRVAYIHAQKADRIKTIFLHNMTNQMIDPSDAICKDVEVLSHTPENIKQLVDDIQLNGKTITELLHNLLNMSDEEMRKEGLHD